MPIVEASPTGGTENITFVEAFGRIIFVGTPEGCRRTFG
jgi:hypothetical protein